MLSAFSVKMYFKYVLQICAVNLEIQIYSTKVLKYLLYLLIAVFPERFL